MKKSMLGIIVLVLVIIGAGIFVLKKPANKSSTAASTTSNNTTTATNSASTNTNPSKDITNDQAHSAATITYTDGGFSPSSSTIKSGGQLTVKNDSSDLLQFDSDPHPNHTDDTELNIGIIQPGSSKTITVNKSGEHGYHNHLNPSQIGSLTVE